MAYTQLTYRWPDGGEVIICISTDSGDRGYPDQMAETKAVALDAYRQIVGIEHADQAAEEPEP